MADYFAAHIAYNPDTEELVRNATFQVFSVDDLSFTTPLELTEAGSGAALPLLVSNRDGAVPAFRVAGEPTQVLVKSGTYVSPLTSVYGTRGAAGKSAYQSAVDGGFLGDEETFTEYLAAVGKGIAVAEIIDGDLQITTKDGEVFTPGQVVGGDGRGISSVAVVDGDLVVTYTDATSQNAGSAAGPPGPPVDTDGATTGQVYTFNGTEPTWAAPAAGIENAPSTWPSTFPPAAHNTETSTLRVSSAALSADVLALLASADKAAARTAIGAGTGTSNLVIGTGAGNAAAGNHSHTATQIPFTPTGDLTATDVQAALAQAATLGGGSANVFYDPVDGWPEDLPSSPNPRNWNSTKYAAAPSPEAFMAIGDTWEPHPDYLDSL